jgi:AcrR family transcriptional regulator
MGRRKSLAEGDITREALVDAAAELFSDQGIDGVSVRSVNSHAGLAPAAVHYHFGSKDRLLDAVLMREGEPVIAAIVETADRLIARRATPTTRQLIETLALPYTQLLERSPQRGIRWLKIVSQLNLAMDGRLGVRFPESSEKMESLVERRFKTVPSEVSSRAWLIGVNTLIQMLSLTPEDEQSMPYAESPYKKAVVDFVVGGVDAAVNSHKVAAARQQAS